MQVKRAARLPGEVVGTRESFTHESVYLILCLWESIASLNCSKFRPPAPAKGEALFVLNTHRSLKSDLLLGNGVYFLQPELPSVIGGEVRGSSRRSG